MPNGGPSNVWYPAEGPVSDRGLNTWFWHPNNSVISFANLQSIYFTSVGMNTTLIFNVPPATTGQLDTPDLDLLRQFGAWYGSLYATNLLQGQPVSADSTWASAGLRRAQGRGRRSLHLLGSSRGPDGGPAGGRAASPGDVHA